MINFYLFLALVIILYYYYIHLFRQIQKLPIETPLFEWQDHLIKNYKAKTSHSINDNTFKQDFPDDRYSKGNILAFPWFAYHMFGRPWYRNFLSKLIYKVLPFFGLKKVTVIRQKRILENNKVGVGQEGKLNPPLPFLVVRQSYDSAFVLVRDWVKKDGAMSLIHLVWLHSVIQYEYWDNLITPYQQNHENYSWYINTLYNETLKLVKQLESPFGGIVVENIFNTKNMFWTNNHQLVKIVNQWKRYGAKINYQVLVHVGNNSSTQGSHPHFIIKSVQTKYEYMDFQTESAVSQCDKNVILM